MKFVMFMALAALLGGVGPLSAQMVVRPDPPLDSARAEVRAVLENFRDSLHAIEAAGARLQRGTHGGSPAWLRARARQIVTACGAAKQSLPATREAIARGSWETSRQRGAQADLLKAFDTLNGKLAWCEQRFTVEDSGAGVEALRNSGNYWRGQLSEALAEYERAAGFLQITLDIKVRPKT